MEAGKRGLTSIYRMDGIRGNRKVAPSVAPSVSFGLEAFGVGGLEGVNAGANAVRTAHDGNGAGEGGESRCNEAFGDRVNVVAARFEFGNHCGIEARIDAGVWGAAIRRAGESIASWGPMS